MSNHYDAQATFRDLYAAHLDVVGKYSPRYLEGTPEHAEYVNQLRDELAKFVAGEGDYALSQDWEDAARLDQEQADLEASE